MVVARPMRNACASRKSWAAASQHHSRLSRHDIYNSVARRMRFERVPEIELARYFSAYIQTALRHGSDEDEGFAAMLTVTRHWVGVRHR
jgi:hypothetical protein